MTQPQPNQLRSVNRPEPIVRGDLPQVATELLRCLGGHLGYAQDVAADMLRVRANVAGLPPDKVERLLLSYHRSVQNMMAKKDQYELDTNELAGYTEAELQGMLREAAIQNLKNDPAFRQEVLGVLGQQNPAEVRKMLGVDVIETEAEPSYTEEADIESA